MAHLIVKEPDGKYAIFSTIIDDFVLVNATKEQVLTYEIDISFDNAQLVATDFVDRAMKSISIDRHKDMLKTIDRVHGKNHNPEYLQGEDVIHFMRYTRQDLEEKLRGLTSYLIEELALTQYPRQNYIDTTEKYIEQIK